jgi:AcrR family transcriptional regulator
MSPAGNPADVLNRGEPSGAAATGPQPRRRPVGRPRDPDLERRVFEAAVALYDEVGWAGFNFDAVAARASTGKAALYRRWASKEELLAAALVDRTRGVTTADTGTLRGDLELLAEQLLANYTSPNGLVSLRLLVEAQYHPELGARAVERLDSHLAESAQIAQRAVARGELAADDASVVMVAVSGGVLHMVLASRDRSDLRRRRRAHARRLVDFVLRAAPAAALGPGAKTAQS